MKNQMMKIFMKKEKRNIRMMKKKIQRRYSNQGKEENKSNNKKKLYKKIIKIIKMKVTEILILLKERKRKNYQVTMIY